MPFSVRNFMAYAICRANSTLLLVVSGWERGKTHMSMHIHTNKRESKELTGNWLWSGSLASFIIPCMSPYWTMGYTTSGIQLSSTLTRSTGKILGCWMPFIRVAFSRNRTISSRLPPSGKPTQKYMYERVQTTGTHVHVQVCTWRSTRAVCSLRCCRSLIASWRIHTWTWKYKIAVNHQTLGCGCNGTGIRAHRTHQLTCEHLDRHRLTATHDICPH